MPPSRNRPLVTPREAAPRRHAVERRAAVWLLYVGRLPRWTVAAVVAAIFLAGAFAPGLAGAVALFVVLGLLIVLAFVTWHEVSPSGRLLRVLTGAVLLAWALGKAL